ncbi:hypothetical protein VWV82_001753 [Cronobacter malonaticus]|uniref:hypothetical protein n=1 Tax=Cronobacter malonaticus TaxID=413503 RepID=UPI002DD4D322|nr:hypothetical protein [Cronobacter malonaticus]
MFNRIFTIKMKSTGHNQKTNLNVMAVEVIGKSGKSTDWSGNTEKKAPVMALLMPVRNLHYRRRQPR